MEAPDFAKITFDYLVVGGGTAGTVVSARLTEDPAITVGVIEAGGIRLNDDNINTPGSTPRLLGNADYDWMFASIPQGHLSERQISFPRGKVLGGSSACNFMAWGRASSPEYNAWGSLVSDDSWSFSGLLPYLQKVEHVSSVESDPFPGSSKPRDVDGIIGTSGPIKASKNVQYFDATLSMVATLNHLGIHTNSHPTAGHSLGVSNSYMNIDREKGVRSYAATAYYSPNANRPNYHVLPHAQVTRILFSPDRSDTGSLKAIGVEFIVNGVTYTAQAKCEVIVCAGTVKTPQLLELSGIGNPTILAQHGIPTLLDLPQVGENLQEHLFVAVQWKMKPGVQTFDILGNDGEFAKKQQEIYAESRTGMLTTTDSLTAFLRLKDLLPRDRLERLLEIFDNTAAQGSIPLHRHQSDLRRDWYQGDDVPTIELIQFTRGFIAPETNQSYVTMIGGIMHPSSRGSVHINSNDPLAKPSIDPRFLDNDFDTELLLEVLKYIQKIGQTSPFADIVETQTHPSSDAEEDLLRSYLKMASSAGQHISGTATMARREDGGVVDQTLTVYGTSNLRVVDASIMPLQIAAHTQATIYGIAEKAADIIKAAHAAHIAA